MSRIVFCVQVRLELLPGTGAGRRRPAARAAPGSRRRSPASRRARSVSTGYWLAELAHRATILLPSWQCRRGPARRSAAVISACGRHLRPVAGGGRGRRVPARTARPAARRSRRTAPGPVRNPARPATARPRPGRPRRRSIRVPRPPSFWVYARCCAASASAICSLHRLELAVQPGELGGGRLELALLGLELLDRG